MGYSPIWPMIASLMALSFMVVAVDMSKCCQHTIIIATEQSEMNLKVGL